MSMFDMHVYKPIDAGKRRTVNPNVKRQPVIGTVKSSMFEGLNISTIVELAAINKDSIAIQEYSICWILSGNQ